MSKVSKFVELANNPPKLEVKENAREVILNLVSCMCDNKHKWTFKKNEDGDFKIHTNGFAFSNFSTKYGRDEMEWEADEAEWNEVFRMVNSGTSRVESIRSR